MMSVQEQAGNEKSRVFYWYAKHKYILKLLFPEKSAPPPFYLQTKLILMWNS